MKRSAGITVIAILSLIGSAFMLLMAIFVARVPLMAPVSSSPGLPSSTAFFKAMFVGIALFFALLATWGILTSIGLFRLREWARISIIVFSVLVVLQGTFGVLTLLVMPILPSPNQAADPAIMMGVRIFMAGFSLALLSLGVWWLVFFTREKVTEQFASAPAALLAPPASQVFPSTFAPPVVASLPGSTGCPLSFTILAWLMLVSCLFIPLNLLLHAPIVLFTKILTGKPAVVCLIALLALWLYIGIGLLRLRLTARIVAIAYCCFMFASTATFYLAPGGSSRVQDVLRRSEAMFPWIQPWQNQQSFLFDARPFMVVGACIGLAALLVPLYFLITRKGAFEKAAAARRLAVPSQS